MAPTLASFIFPARNGQYNAFLRAIHFTKRVDLQALGRSIYGLCCGLSFMWYCLARRRTTVPVKTPDKGYMSRELYDILRTYLMQRLDLLQDVDPWEVKSLDVIRFFSAVLRTSAVSLHYRLSTAITNERKEVITPSAVNVAKRPPLACEMEPEQMERV